MSATIWERQEPAKRTFLRRANTAKEIAVCTSLRTQTMALDFETDLGEISLIFSFDDMEDFANEILHYVSEARAAAQPPSRGDGSVRAKGGATQ